MFKRSIARLLVFFQLYGVVFQGVAHANILQHYPVQNEIYLHSSFDEAGGLRLSLGTDSPAKGLETLGVIDVPSYKTLKSQNQKLKIQVVPSDSSSSDFSASEDLLSPVSSSFVSTDDDTDVEEDADTGDDSIAFTTQDGIVRLPEGVYFDLQGLQIFMNNEGELLIQGAQTDFTKPIFLSSKKSIVLHSVEANVLKLTSPSVVGVGKSSIDFLALEGLMSDEGEEVAATYINTGSLTAKEVFLKNLTFSNMGTLTTDGFEAQGVTFRNTGTLAMSADAQSGNRAFTETTVINDGNIEGLHYNISGSSFTQNGRLKGRVLSVDQDTTFTTGAHQELTLSERLDSASLARWKLTGTVNVHEFNHLGPIDLEGTLNTTTFTGHGTVKPTGTFTSERSHFTDAFTNLGQVSTHVLDADAAITTNGLMRVSSAADIRGKFKVGAKGRFIGIEDQSLSLTCHDTANIAGKVDVDSLITAKAISVKGRGQLITRQSTTLTDQLTIQPKSVVQFKGLKANGAFIDNHGTLTVEGIETGAAGLTLTNAGTAHIDAEQILPRASEDEPENTARIAAILPIDAEFIVRGEEARSEAIEDRALLAYQQIQRIPINPIITQWNASIFYSMLADQNSYEAQEIIVCGIGGKKSLSIQAGFAEVHRRKAAGDSVAQSLLETNICRTYDEQDALISEYNRQSHQQKQAYAAGFKREDYANFEEFEAALKKRNWESCLLLKPTEIVGGALRDATIDSVLSGFAELQRRNDAGDLVAKSLLSKRVPKSLKDKLQFIEQYNNDLRMQQLAYAVGESYINLTDLEATLKEKNRVKYAASEVQEIVVCGIGGEKSLSIQAGIAELHRRKDAGDLIAKSLLEKMPCKTYRNMEKIIDEYNAQIRMQRQAYAEYLKEVEQRPETTEIEFLRNGSERQAIIDGLIELQRRNDAGDLVAKSILSKGLIGNLFDRVLLIENYNNDLKMQRILKAADCKTMRFHDLATACLETISTLPSHEREALLTAMQERVSLVAPMYLGRFGFSDSTGPSAFTELRTNVVAQIQTDADITMQQLQDIADCKAFMPAVRPIKLKLTNQATGQVTLKSGRFDFVEDTAFSNDGTLVQDHACLHWITGLPGAFNQGTWAVKGSLGLVGYKAEDVGTLEVEETLHVHTTEDALKALGSMSKVKAAKIVMHAPQLRHTTATEMVLPWVLELHLDEDFSSVGNIATCGLQLFCKGFDGNADLAAGIQDGVDITSEEQGFLKVTATENVKLGVNGYFYGKKGVGVKAKNLAVEGRQAVPGAGAPSILYKRSGNGLYSEEGPVVIDTEGTFHNNFGTISALYYIIKGKVFHNIAGLLQGKDATQQSQIIAETVRSVREVPNTQSAYGCPGHPWRKTHTFHGDSTGVDKCGGLGCRPSYTNYETSLQSVIEHAGDLEIIYRTLVNEVSDISSSKSVFLDARSADQTLNVGDAGTRIQLEENQLLRTATPHQGVTAIWDRNGHTSLIRGKQGISGTLGSAHLEGGMRGNSIALRAAEMTFQNMQLNKKQAASLLNLAQSIQNGGSSIYKRLGNTEVFDTRFPLASGQYPHSIVAMGAMPQKIDLWATWGAFEHAFGQNFPYLYRGLDYLGISFAQLCEVTAEEVRSRAGSEVRRHLIEDSKGCYEIDVVTHPELMTASDLKKSPLPMLVMEFGRNASRAEDDMLRAQQAKVAEAKGKSLGERAQELLKAAHTQPKAQFDISLVVPAEEDSRSGIFATQGRNDITVTEGDFVSRGITVSGHDGSISAPKGKVKILSEAVTVGDSDNFHQVLNRATIENTGTGDFLVACADDVELEGTIFDTQVPGSSITLHTPKRIIDSAKGAASRQTSHSAGKKSGKRVSTTTVSDSLIMHPTKAMGLGTVNMNAGSGVSLQAPDVSCAVKITSPFFEFREAHNQFSSRSTTTIQGKRGVCGGSGSKKSISSLTQAFHSLGGKLKGPEFIAHVEHCSMTNVLFDTPHAVIHAEQAQFPAGTNSSSSQTRTMYNGTMWNVHKMQSESHLTRSPCQFKQPVTVHGQKATVEQRPGSAPVSNLITTNPVTYLDVADHHDSSSKSQKSLSMGAALVLKLALTLSMGNPFAASSIPSAMASAGYSTLCGEAMVCLVENDGNPGRAMHALGERNIGKSIVRSMATAGLTKGIGGLCGVTDALTIPNLARQYLIQSAITTTMSVVVDKQNIGDAMRQGATSAVVNTVAAWSAGQIGDLASEKMGAAKISSPTQTGLHFATGAVAGGISAAILGGDIGREALARGAGAVVGHKLAETFGDMGMETNTAAQLGNIGTVGLAMLTDQDVMAAYQGSCNAIEHNFSRHRLNPIENLVKSVKKGMEVKEGEAATPEQEAYERGRQLYVRDSLELACQLNGGPLSEESAERIVSNANELYATKYTTDLCGSMIGKTIVGASELIPGMRGINKAWMGVVNHTRGDLSDEQLADEILGGIHSALTDAAFCVATAGAAHYYRSAKMVVGAAKEAAKVGGEGAKKSVRFVDEGGVKLTESGRMYGTHRDLTKAGAQDSHHIIQHAAAKEIPGYNFLDAPTVQLKGPSQMIGTEHQLATRVQRASGGGNYSAERRIGYKALRRAGVSESEARSVVNHTDEYFQKLGVKPDTKTTIPGNRKGIQ